MRETCFTAIWRRILLLTKTDLAWRENPGSNRFLSLVPVPKPDLEKAGDYSRILFAIELPIYMVELRGGRDFLRIVETPRRMRDES